MLGLFERHTPKFVKQYAKLGEIAKSAIKEYVSEVQEGKFPAEEHCY
jgi:3-methyl-2-oxobutanoate hydroxymethyltransferase